MTRKEQTTKEKILRAAEEEFALRGYAGARTQEIAQKAAVNKALIHYYYKDKASLYQAVLDEMMFDLIRISQNVSKRHLKGAALVEGLFSEFFDYAARHQYFARLTTLESSAGETKYLETSIRNLFRPLFQRGVEFLEEHIAKKSIRKVDAPHFLVTVFLMTLSYFSEAEWISILLGKEATSPSVLAQRKKALLDFIFAMLGIRP
jgi:TetR/AcrR family transcriptional regulator